MKKKFVTLDNEFKIISPDRYVKIIDKSDLKIWIKNSKFNT